MTQARNHDDSTTLATTSFSPLLLLARVLDAALLLVVTPILVLDGLPDLSRLSAVEFILMLNLLAAYAGLVIAWRLEVIGGSLAVLAIAGFYVTERLATGRFPESPTLMSMGAVGALFLVEKLSRTRSPTSRTREPTGRAGSGRRPSEEKRGDSWSTTFSS